MGVWTNWAGDQSCRPAEVVRPRDRDELAAAIVRAAEAGRPVSVAGSGHSFTEAPMTGGTMIRVEALSRVIDADPDSGLVKVGGGTVLADLNEELAALGLAMENLGDIDRQTIAGAISTATHGTGARLPNISAQVEAIEMVLADGSVRDLREPAAPTGSAPPHGAPEPAAPSVSSSSQPAQYASSSPSGAPPFGGDPGASPPPASSDLLRAARVSVGALGAISAVTLRCVPAFTLHRVDSRHPREEVLDSFDERAAAHEHFELFTFPYADSALVLERNRVDAPPRPRGRAAAWLNDTVLENWALGALSATGRALPRAIPALSRLAAGLASGSRATDRSDRIFASDRRVRFTEMEYGVPREHGPEALRRVIDWVRSNRYPVFFPIEMRVTAADDAHLSPSHRRDTAYIAVHQYKGMEWRPYFEAVEAIMDDYEGRPHWGKRHFQTAATLAPRYPAWADYQAARDTLDPRRVFTNEYASRVLDP